MQSTLTRRTIMALAGTAAALSSPLVMAHVAADGAAHIHGNALHSLAMGAWHPLTGLDHLAAMLSVGAWSALSLAPGAEAGGRPARQARLAALLAAPAAFAGTLLLGAVLGLAGLHLPGVEPMIAASLLVLGLLVATRLRLPTGLGAALVAVFALFHGLAHGSELGGHAVAALSGMVASTAALHGLGMACGLALRHQAGDTAATGRLRQGATRLAGAAVALLGLGLLAPSLAAAL